MAGKARSCEVSGECKGQAEPSQEPGGMAGLQL